MLTRVQKQVFISSIYVLIILLAAGGWIWGKRQMLCSDGIKNGLEEGLDCGVRACGVACAAPVMNLEIQSNTLIKTPANDYDFTTRIYNPNTNYGIQQGTYDVVFKDSNNKETSRIKGQSFYILPGQTKYLVLTSIKNIPNSQTASVEVKHVQWIGTTGNTSSNLTLSSQTFSPKSNQTTFEAVVSNGSPFDFDKIDVGIVVFDSNNQIVATNTTTIKTLFSQDARSFKVTWPFMLPSNSRVYIEVGTNLFDNSNFIKAHGTQEKFQQFF